MRIYKRQKGDKWHIEIRDHHRRVRKFAGFTDKGQTRTFGNNIEKLVSCKGSGNPPGPELSAWVNAQPERTRVRLAKMGLITLCQAARGKRLTELLEQFKPTLLEKRGSPKQQALVMTRLQKIVKGCDATWLEDLTKKRVASFLDSQLEQGADPASKVRFGRQTYNFYVKNARRFGVWLRKELGLEIAPLEDLEVKAFNRRKDQVHERRALTQAEAVALLRAAKDGDTILGMTSHQRYLAYKIAIETGLRRGEIRALDRDCFDFSNAREPKVRLSGRYTKNGQDAVLPLRQDMATEIQAYVKWRVGPLFPLPDKSAVMIKLDCKKANIPYKDSNGRYGDFHALRHSCATFLAQAGVHPKTCQQIMRHSDINLTMTYYTAFMVGSEYPAVESMWKTSATGTDK